MSVSQGTCTQLLKAKWEYIKAQKESECSISMVSPCVEHPLETPKTYILSGLPYLAPSIEGDFS